MFDIGFPELLIVGIIALIVIGPERLPETVRTVALWVGRMRRSFARIKAELEQEIGADDIRRQLHNESIMDHLKDARSDLNSIITDATSSMEDIAKSAKIEPDQPKVAQPNTHDGKKQPESN
jgi:sec-independent protein translocase protein TatB